MFKNVRLQFVFEFCRTQAEFVLENSPVKVWPVKLLTYKSLNFLPPQYILDNLVHPCGNVK